MGSDSIKKELKASDDTRRGVEDQVSRNTQVREY
jgi:hypothetical protein